MSSFSVWHWLIVLIILGLYVGLPVITKWTTRRKYPGELKGIGGWLCLLAIVYITGMLISLSLYPKIEAGLTETLRRNLPVTITVSYVIVTLFVASHLAVVVALFMKTNNFRTIVLLITVWEIIFLPLFWCCTAIGVSAELNAPLGTVFSNVVDAAEVGQWIGSSIGWLIWLAYVRRSKRVANTYGYLTPSASDAAACQTT